jgi:hypothetical protein
MNVPPEEAREIMDGDPCVRARMILCEVQSYDLNLWIGDPFEGAAYLPR